MGLNTKHLPLRLLGYKSDETALRITEEQRPHIHLIGTTQEGKSKFIERLIRGDIKRGLGCCLIDPTAGGKTVYDVLRYCAYKKIEKVCLIDPFHRWEHTYNTVVGVSPFLYTSEGKRSDFLKETCLKDFQDTVNVLFNVTDETQTMRIGRYLPAVLNVLYDNKCPLRDVKYFTNRLYKNQREKLLENAEDASRLDIEEVFSDRQAYNNFQSTVSRMKRFFQGTIGLMFSPLETINFMKLVSEGWIILVNLDSALGFDTLDSRLLGTYIINQITTCIERLNKKGRYKPFYLYIDEASDYANRKLAQALSKKQKTVLKVTLAHQYLEQFEDKFVRDSVLANCKITAQFNLQMTKDRDLISEQFYGGDIKPKDASYANSDLKVQYAVIKSIKGKPVRVKIPNVQEPPISDDEVKAYVRQLYLSQPWYHNAKELKENLDEPTRQTTTDPRPAKARTQTHGKTTGTSGVSNRKKDDGKWKSLSDHLSVRKKNVDEDGGTEGD